MSVNTRVIDNENNRSLYAGDEVEGQLATEQVALGNAEEIAMAVSPAAAPVEEAPATQAETRAPARVTKATKG